MSAGALESLVAPGPSQPAPIPQTQTRFRKPRATSLQDKTNINRTPPSEGDDISSGTSLVPKSPAPTHFIDFDNRFPPPRRKRCCCCCTLNCFHYVVVAFCLFLVLSFIYGCIMYPKAAGVDGAVTSLIQGVGCGACRALLVSLKALANEGDEVFSDTFVQICTDLKIQKPDVCQGAVPPQTSIMAHDLRNINIWSTAADQWCTVVFGICANKAVRNYSVTLQPKSPALTAAPVAVSGSKPFQVIHVSDVHIDRNYQEGTETACGRPICCENFDANSTGPGVKFPAPKYGNHSCDTPLALVDTLYTSIIDKNASFSILTGDVVADDVWKITRSEVEADLPDFYHSYPGKLYGSSGNHDTSPVNSVPRKSTTTNSSQWIYDAYASSWNQPEAATQSGCYSTIVNGTNLKLVVLNTQLWYRQNIWLYDSDSIQSDPDGIIAWLANELQEAETAGQPVWIIGHTPPGKADFLRDQSNYLNQVFQRYAETIAGLFFGHTHADEFEVGYNDNVNRNASSANLVAFIGGAVTPNNGNPMYRVYDVDPDTYKIMDYKVYLANISNPAFENSTTKWQLSYSARESYGPLTNPPLGSREPLSPSFFHRLTEVFETNQTAMNMFFQRTRGGFFASPQAAICNSDCVKQWICSLRALRSEDNCVTVMPAINFGRRTRKRSWIPSLGFSSSFESEGEEEEEEGLTETYEWEEEPPHPCEGVGAISVLTHLGRKARRGDTETLNDFHQLVTRRLQLRRRELGEL
ncbi:sphingomyelin phosphodiesterase [Meredithblackwellia eburnea MCA 4105]